MRSLPLAMAFYFLLGSFLPQSDFSQLRRIGKLLTHYELHQHLAADEGDTLSFTQYLCIHFIHPDHHEHGDESHKDLPLHHFQTFTQLTPLPHVWQLRFPLRKQQVGFAPFHDHPSYLLATTLFRPPIA